MDEPKIKKAMCSECQGIRNCEVRGSTVTKWDDAGGLVWGQTDWFILQCRGCEHVFCQTVEVFSEDYNHEWDETTQQDIVTYSEKVSYWPAISKRKIPDWFAPMGFAGDRSDVLHSSMQELYVALENDLMRLAATGVRSTFDLASELLDVDPALTFKEKLDELVTNGRINAVDRDRLETLTEAGNASIHRGWVPEASDLSTMVDILEHFVHRTFVAPALEEKLNERSASLKKIVPVKKPRMKAKKKRE